MGPFTSIGLFGLIVLSTVKATKTPNFSANGREKGERDFRRQFKPVRTQSLSDGVRSATSERMRIGDSQEEEPVSLGGGGKHRILAELARVEQEVVFLEVN